MKAIMLIIGGLFYSNLASSQQTQTCDFCNKLLEIAREHSTEFSEQEIFQFLKDTKLSESKGSHKNGRGFSYEDLNLNSKSDREEYNKIHEVNTTFLSYNNIAFLQKVAVSLKGWDAINNCIQQLGLDNVYKNRSYLSYKVMNNEIEITLWPIADYGTNKIKLLDFKITGPVEYSKKNNSAYQVLKKGCKLTSNQPVNTTYIIKKPCGNINISYRLSNMLSSVTIPIIYDNFKVIDQTIADTTFTFDNNSISDLNGLEEKNYFFTGLIHYFIDDNNIKLLRAKIEVTLWNSNMEKDNKWTYTIGDLVLLKAKTGKSLSMNHQVIKFNNGKLGNKNNGGLRIEPTGGNINFNYTLNNDNPDLNSFGTFDLYVDENDVRIDYKPTSYLLSFLKLKTVDDCK